MPPQLRQVSLGLAISIAYLVSVCVPFVMILETPGPECFLTAMGINCLISIIILRHYKLKKRDNQLKF
jgi:hypothetical protein